jgi:hypothetical protein
MNDNWVKAWTIKDDPNAKFLRSRILGVKTTDAHVYIQSDPNVYIEAEENGMAIGAVKVRFGDRTEIFTLAEADALATALHRTVDLIDSVLDEAGL